MVVIIYSSRALLSWRSTAFLGCWRSTAFLGCDHSCSKAQKLELSLVAIISNSPPRELWWHSSGSRGAPVVAREDLGFLPFLPRSPPGPILLRLLLHSCSTPDQSSWSCRGVAILQPLATLIYSFFGFIWGCENLNFFSILLRIWPQPPFPPQTVTYSITVELVTAKVLPPNVF